MGEKSLYCEVTDGDLRMAKY